VFEGWSMVIPWVRFFISELLNKVRIKPNAKFVEFETVYNLRRWLDKDILF